MENESDKLTKLLGIKPKYWLSSDSEDLEMLRNKDYKSVVIETIIGLFEIRDFTKIQQSAQSVNWEV